jgi:hypothetical protein
MSELALIVALVAVLLSGGTGFKLGMDHQKATESDKAELVSEAADAASNAAAAAISALVPKYTTIKSEVQREIHTNTVYGDCKLTPIGLHLANQALDPNATFSLGDGKLPKADPAK